MMVGIIEFLDALGDLLAGAIECDRARSDEQIRRVIITPRAESDFDRDQVDLVIAYHALDKPPGQEPFPHIVCGPLLENSPLGAEAVLALALGLCDPAPLREQVLAPSKEVKLVVFTPIGHETPVIEAIAEGGGGIIGEYDTCTFRAPGVGTYRPLEGASPWAGKTGRVENAQETRIETRVKRQCVARLLRLVRQVHPYEEMAYDIVPLEELRDAPLSCAIRGRLPKPLGVDTLTERIGKAFGTGSHRARGGDDTEKCERLALGLGGARRVSDAGGEGVVEAAIKAECDTLVADGLSDEARRAASLEMNVIEPDGETLARDALLRLADALARDPRLRGVEIALDHGF